MASTPRSPIRRLVSPFLAFTRLEAAGGLLLMATAALALIWSNSPLAASYEATWSAYVTLGWRELSLSKPVLLWINDGLMAVFFLLVGLEIKRELLAGELDSPRKAALPLAAAVGGMAVPAALYLAVTGGTDAARGWGVPVATDIAFALGVLLLLGSRIPLGLKVFLTAVAIVDDLGAVLVIALFYTSGVSLEALLASGSILAILAGLNLAGVRSLVPYLALGAGLWLAVLLSGVHATIAGVLLAATIPLAGPGAPEGRTSPLETLEHGLHPWVVFGILPVFALANAGVALGGIDLDPVATSVAGGVAVGLLVGKPVGILAASWLAVRAGLASLPKGVTWRSMTGVSFLCAIGFTMSLFIAGLAFPTPALLDAAKVGVLAASGLAALLGAGVLLLPARQASPEASTDASPSEERERRGAPRAAAPAGI